VFLVVQFVDVEIILSVDSLGLTTLYGEGLCWIVYKYLP